MTLTNGKGLTSNTTNEIGFELLCINSVSGTYNFTVLLDFVYQYKEPLTLPLVSQLISLRKKWNMIEIPILSREGGQQQGLGQMSAYITVGVI